MAKPSSITLHNEIERCDREIVIALADLTRDARWVLAYYDWHCERRMLLRELSELEKERTRQQQMEPTTTTTTHTPTPTTTALSLIDVFRIKDTTTADGEIVDVGASYQRDALNAFATLCHEANKNWWLDLDRPCLHCERGGVPTLLDALRKTPDSGACSYCKGTGHPRKDRNVGELLMLCVAELAEALEGHRKNLDDDKLPHRKMFEVELADTLIRIFDLCGGMGLDIGGAFVEKQEYNRTRADHKLANRKQSGGKAY